MECFLRQANKKFTGGPTGPGNPLGPENPVGPYTEMVKWYTLQRIKLKFTISPG